MNFSDITREQMIFGAFALMTFLLLVSLTNQLFMEDDYNNELKEYVKECNDKLEQAQGLVSIGDQLPLSYPLAEGISYNISQS